MLFYISRTLLKESEANSNYKDFEIQRLTRELVGLRLEHAHCKRVVGAEKETDPSTHLATPSLADSGHFDDLSYQASQSKDFLMDKEVDLLASTSWSAEKNRIINAHTEKMEDLIKQHTIEVYLVTCKYTKNLNVTRFHFLIQVARCPNSVHRSAGVGFNPAR